MDGLHDVVQTIVHLVGFPAQVLGILRHLQTGCSYAACIDSLTRGKQYAVVLEEVNSTGLATHVTYLAAAPAAVGFQLLGIVLAQLVLEGARQSDVALDRPGFLVRSEVYLTGELSSHILYAVAVRGAHHEHVINHLVGDAVGNLHYAVRTGDGYYLCAELFGFGGSAPCYVTEAGDGDTFALDRLACGVQQVLGEVQCAETCCLRTQDRTAPRHAFAGQHAGVVLASEFLVHAVQEAYLTTAYTYVTGRYILIRANATPEFEHERLAETHDLVVGFAYGVEVRTTLGAAHRQGRQGVLEGLLKSEELEHRRCNGAVETQSAFVRANGSVELHTVTEVRLYLALVVNPCYAEREDTVGLNHALDDLRTLKLRMLVVGLLDRLENFLYSL